MVVEFGFLFVVLVEFSEYGVEVGDRVFLDGA